ncbi:hypothetical protein HFP15_34275 [Amycolatopsis sp. K13G38]|uniref:DUF4878 domain-containing protein n=1 Tax=Amycolatopsis acididurans TaxID=2724524 RepID=A0ABX1JHP3_9PSEU|nr:hypothetical protein [Amycolatopsis acididurans]NKQ57940.1 hypothetical protein [Amycolatopsis acididurans]
MTYPPQQPGGQDPYGNQGQWGQQPGGYPPPGGQPGQPGGYPPPPGGAPGYPGGQPAGGFPPGGPQQPGQPGQQHWGQQQPWGQPGEQQSMGHPGGFGAEPPKKKKTGLIIGIVAAVVVLVGGGVTAAVLLLGGPDLSTPEGLQEAVVDAYNGRNVDDFRPLLCAAPSDGDMKSLGDVLAKIPAGVTYSVAKPPAVKGDSAQLTLQAGAGGQQKSFPLPIKKNGDKWCVPNS